jgi:hypothetical protein
MTTLTNLTGTPAASAASAAAHATNSNPPAKPEAAISNVQSGKGFWRRIKHGQSKLVFESSAGGAVTINISDLWKLAESSDPKLAIPVATTPAT